MAKALNLRLSDELHRALAEEAKQQGISLNTLINTALAWWLNPESHKGAER